MGEGKEAQLGFVGLVTHHPGLGSLTARVCQAVSLSVPGSRAPFPLPGPLTQVTPSFLSSTSVFVISQKGKGQGFFIIIIITTIKRRPPYGRLEGSRRTMTSLLVDAPCALYWSRAFARCYDNPERCAYQRPQAAPSACGLAAASLLG